MPFKPKTPTLGMVLDCRSVDDNDRARLVLSSGPGLIMQLCGEQCGPGRKLSPFCVDQEFSKIFEYYDINEKIRKEANFSQWTPHIGIEATSELKGLPHIIMSVEGILLARFSLQATIRSIQPTDVKRLRLETRADPKQHYKRLVSVA